MDFAFYIGKRYLFTKSSSNAINIMTLIAATGIVVTAAALFIVLSGFGGLKAFSLGFSSIVDPDLKIVASKGKSFNVSQKDYRELLNINGVTAISKVIEDRSILEFENKNLLVTLKGVDDNFLKVSKIDSMVVMGQWFTADTGQIVSGWGIANNLSFGVLDYGKAPKLYVPKPGKGQISSIKDAYSTISAVNIGIFQINEDLDNTYVFTDIANARRLLGFDTDAVSAIEIKCLPGANENDTRKAIENIFGNTVAIKNKTQLNDALYKMLNTEHLVVYLIFTLIIIIALFNVVGALIMMVLDKKRLLHTLFNLGATVKDIRRIFFFQGSLMTIFGGIAGLILGIALVLLQKQFALVMLTTSLPYPVTFEVANVFIVLATISILGIVASKLAASRIDENLVKP
ncbi:MAG TPA: ABC transporter permease [Aquaticitalea sp.]|nr:ABC transporter permease [Aquaticitalea sp.]